MGPGGDAALAELRGWLTARGAVLEGARPAVLAGGLRGLAATADASSGALLLSVPLSATLSAATFSGAEGLREAVAGSEEEPQLYLSTLVVLYELLLTPTRSPWTAYLRTLPRDFSELPIFFQDARPDGAPRLWTRLATLAPLVAAQRDEVSTLRPLLRRAVLRLPGGAAALAPLSETLFAELADWAWAVARTRMLDQPVSAFARGEELLPEGSLKAPTLMPFLDLCNHAEPGSANTQILSDDRILFHAKRDIKAGEELRFTYIDSVGDALADASLRDEQCDAQWLSHYGFLLADGRPERDCWHFQLDLPALRAVTRLPPGARQRLRDAALELSVATVMDGSGTLWVGLLRWLAVAADTHSAKVPWGHTWAADADAWQLLVLTLHAQRSELANALAEAEVLGERDGGDGHNVRQLTKGALRAAEAAQGAAQAGAARMRERGSINLEP